MGTHDSWTEVRRVFQEASDREGADRDAFLATVPDGPVLDEVRSLLAWHTPDTGFLDTPASAALSAPGVAPESLIGSSLGPWRIVGQIGAGGMGVVYRAARADEAFERDVALKVIGALGQSSAGIERFRLERETLARLDHPAIARLLDGGTTPAGAPYFVMELVDGVPVDRYCDEQRLTIAQRIDVFLRICRGVQYAHRNLVVHRDLKPDNILVLADGSPKLLDFGVAKLIAGSRPLTGDDAALAASTWALTPDFASPEQVRGGVVTTASDVYALGVLLHLLLTGLPPYRLGHDTRPAMAAALSSIRIAAPSTRTLEGDGALRASRRHLTPAALARRLAGDLDAIILRAVAADPADRYETVDELMHDLQRHRQARPVHARSRTPRYVASRFVRRHRVGVAASVAALVLGTVGIGAILWQSALAREAGARAERRFDDLRAMTRVFMFDVHDAILNVPGTTDARALMVRTAMQYLERLSAEADPDSSLRRELAAGFVKVGDAQGNPSSPNVGDSAGARASYGRAIEIAGALVAADVTDLDAARTLALAHRRLADVLAWMGDKDTALTHAEASAARFAGIATRPGVTTDDRLHAVIGQIKIGDLLGNPNLPNLGRPDAAMARYDQALVAVRALDQTAPSDQRVRRYVGLTYERIGSIHQLASRWSEAEAAYRASFVIREALAASAPVHVDIQRDLAIAYEKLANVERRSGDLEAAVTYARGALDRFERLASLDAANTNAMRSVAISREHLADLLLDRGQRQEAVAVLQVALTGHRSLADRDASNAQAPCDVARVGDRVGDLLGNGLPTPAACDAWREAERMRRRRAPSGCGASGDDAPTIAARLFRCGGAAAGAR
jgi:non-specific serine/threonine protein kinase/serine/threonine-protein kinase